MLSRIGAGAGAREWLDAEIADLARGFGVSREAIVRRLLSFGRATQEFYNRKRAQYLAEYLASRERKREVETTKQEIQRNMPQEALSNLGRPLVRMILGNYYQERITLSDVSGYLGIKTKHIPKLESVVR